MAKLRRTSVASKSTRHLALEMRLVRKELSVAVQRHEQQAEELRASNEELQVMNEELQVMNGELQRARDELEMRVQERTRELAGANASLDQEVRVRREAEDRIRGLLRQLITVQEDERRRIARDLHDHLGQQTAALRLKLEAVRSASGRHRLPDALDATNQVLSTLDRDLDFFTRELRPPMLDDLGLVIALRNFVNEWSSSFGIPAEFHTRGMDEVRLPLDAETGLYRIAQEALNNIHKHANATRVTVMLDRRGPEARLVIEDNGRGFDRGGGVLGGPDRGIGLIGMSERAGLIGGTLDIETSPGSGTAIFVRMPVTQAART